MTQFPSVCLATHRGGAANLVNGIAQAYEELSPVIAIAGERPSSKEPDKSQRAIDQVSLFRPITKLAVSIKEPAQVAGTIKEAFRVAATVPAGPVYIGLPTDVASMPSPVEPAAMEVRETTSTVPKTPSQGSQLWPHALQPAEVMGVISDLMPDNAIVTVDVGDIIIYTSRFLEPKNREFLRAGRFGNMSFGLTAALAAKMVQAEASVYCITGDGGLAMVVHDLETAVREQLKVTVLVFNNSCLSMIRRRQNAEYQGRIIGCDFCDNDFAQIARGFGAAAERVTSMDALRQGMANAQRSELPYVLDIVVGWDESL
jgi:thiamine pyrophosphate-dependent acetolactate synthase large subunit-like protein